MNLLSEKEMEYEINETIKVLKETLATEIISFLNYLRIYIRSNYFVSALNTNLMLSTHLTKNQYNIYQLQTQYSAKTNDGYFEKESLLCGTDDLISPVGFFSNQNTTGVHMHSTWWKPTENISIVKGFFVGCTPLESILSSTLDCLYDNQCIQLLYSYFPTLEQVIISVLFSLFFVIHYVL